MQYARGISHETFTYVFRGLVPITFFVTCGGIFSIIVLTFLKIRIISVKLSTVLKTYWKLTMMVLIIWPETWVYQEIIGVNNFVWVSSCSCKKEYTWDNNIFVKFTRIIVTIAPRCLLQMLTIFYFLLLLQKTSR